MGLRLTARRQAQRLMAVGNDEVLLGISLPSDTVINSIKFSGGILPNVQGQELDSDVVAQYALEAWVLPIFDPDAGVNFDTVWDTLVPKDSDVQTLDLDTGTTDTAPFWEPGETNLQAIFDLGIRPRRLWHHKKTLTVNNTMGLRFPDSQTPFEAKWQIGDEFSFNLRKPLRVTQPSVFLIGVGMPSNERTQTTVELPLSENEWGRVKYLGDVLIMALHEVLGITEAGAESPWEDAADIMDKHLEPDVMEETAGFWGGDSAHFYGLLEVVHTVVGTLAIQSIDDGR